MNVLSAAAVSIVINTNIAMIIVSIFIILCFFIRCNFNYLITLHDLTVIYIINYPAFIVITIIIAIIFILTIVIVSKQRESLLYILESFKLC